MFGLLCGQLDTRPGIIVSASVECMVRVAIFPNISDYRN